MLRSVVPNCNNDTQALVLEKSVDYIEYLKQQYSDLLSQALDLETEYKALGGTKEYLKHCDIPDVDDQGEST